MWFAWEIRTPNVRIEFINPELTVVSEVPGDMVVRSWLVPSAYVTPKPSI
jgi:hypothetical protein